MIINWLSCNLGILILCGSVVITLLPFPNHLDLLLEIEEFLVLIAFLIFFVRFWNLCLLCWINIENFPGTSLVPTDPWPLYYAHQFELGLLLASTTYSWS